MTNAYTWIGWNRHKRIYDAILVGAIFAYLAIFIALAQVLGPAGQHDDVPITLIRATGTGAIALLTIVLCIGPLARLDTRFLPLLYNRRHLGVATFLVALAHAAIVLVYYHGFGDMNPFVSLLVNTTRRGVPFELFGVAALLILFLMAATSHDFWLKNLSPPVWKALHMSVYAAFALLVVHVSFGPLQTERAPIYPILLGGAAILVGTLHLVAGRRETARDASANPTTRRTSEAWIDAGPWRDIPNERARIVCPPGAERIALFRHGDTLSAISNVCAHQNGPLGEGRVIDGCVTCPWHGYQYLPHNGQSPPPYTEKIPTYQVRLQGDRVLVNPTPKPPGTPVEPARLPPEPPR